MRGRMREMAQSTQASFILTSDSYRHTIVAVSTSQASPRWLRAVLAGICFDIGDVREVAMNHKPTSAGFRALLSLAAVSFLGGVLNAQDLRGRVQGAVTDASQSVIVGAKVTLLNVNTGESAS